MQLLIEAIKIILCFNRFVIHLFFHTKWMQLNRCKFWLLNFNQQPKQPVFDSSLAFRIWLFIYDLDLFDFIMRTGARLLLFCVASICFCSALHWIRFVSIELLLSSRRLCFVCLLLASHICVRIMSLIYECLQFNVSDSLRFVSNNGFCQFPTKRIWSGEFCAFCQLFCNFSIKWR